MLMLMIRHVMRLLLLLRMVVGVMIIHRRIDVRRTARICYTFGNGGFHFTTRVNRRSLVAILGHVAHAGRRVRPVPVHHAVLAAVVGRVPYVHSVEGRKARIRHALRRLAGGGWSSVVRRRYTLPQPDHGRVARVGVDDPVTLGQHRRAVVLVLLVRMLGRNDAAVAEVVYVRITEIRTHVR